MLAKGVFQGVAVECLQDGAQRVERRRPLQGAAEQRVEDDPALLQEADDVAVRGRAGQQRQYGEQQKRRQGIAFARRGSGTSLNASRSRENGTMAASKAQELPIKESHSLVQGQTLSTLPYPNKDPLCATPHPLRTELNSPDPFSQRFVHDMC